MKSCLPVFGWCWALAMKELEVCVLRWNSYRLKDLEKELVECIASSSV